MRRLLGFAGLIALGAGCEATLPGPLNGSSFEASMQGADAVLIGLDDQGVGRRDDGFRAYVADVESTDIPQIDGMRATFTQCERASCPLNGFQVEAGTAELSITLTSISETWICPLVPDGEDWTGRCTVGQVVYDPVFVGADLDVVDAW